MFRVVCGMGGGRGWYAADRLWRLRGLLDRLVGGPGLQRGRRDPEHVRFGEAVDVWRVSGLERDRRLSLRAEMKLPGLAWLEFHVEHGPAGGATLRQRATFAPRGLAGHAYWWAVAAFHGVVFGGMLRGIVRAAEEPG